MSYASSLDTVGLFARSTQDCAQLLAAVAGSDGLDETALRTACMQATHTRPTTLASVRVGVPREYLLAELEPQVERAWRAAAARLAQAGAQLVPLSLPLTPFALPVRVARSIALALHCCASLSACRVCVCLVDVLHHSECGGGVESGALRRRSLRLIVVNRLVRRNISIYFSFL